MDIKQLVTKPKLVRLEVDNPEIVKEVGDSIVFYMKDHMDLNSYFDFYKFQQNQDMDLLVKLLRKTVLDEQGNTVIGEDEILPVDITLAILFKINDYLGKSKAKESTTNDGKEQN